MALIKCKISCGSNYVSIPQVHFLPQLILTTLFADFVIYLKYRLYNSIYSALVIIFSSTGFLVNIKIRNVIYWH